jgi:hypothetical protein
MTGRRSFLVIRIDDLPFLIACRVNVSTSFLTAFRLISVARWAYLMVVVIS